MGFELTNFEYSFKNITFCHCCVLKKQLYLSKISINTHKTGSLDKKRHFLGFAHINFEYSFKNITFCHCCVWKKQLYISKISINTHKTVSYNREAFFMGFENTSFEYSFKNITFCHRYAHPLAFCNHAPEKILVDN